MKMSRFDKPVGYGCGWWGKHTNLLSGFQQFFLLMDFEESGYTLLPINGYNLTPEFHFLYL